MVRATESTPGDLVEGPHTVGVGLEFDAPEGRGVRAGDETRGGK